MGKTPTVHIFYNCHKKNICDCWEKSYERKVLNSYHNYFLSEIHQWILKKILYVSNRFTIGVDDDFSDLFLEFVKRRRYDHCKRQWFDPTMDSAKYETRRRTMREDWGIYEQELKRILDDFVLIECLSYSYSTVIFNKSMAYSHAWYAHFCRCQ